MHMWVYKLLFCMIIVLINSVCTHSDLYALLEVTPDAKDSDIKRNYRKLVLELHPDKIPLNVSETEKEELLSKFLAVQNAYEVLGDSESRLRYDLSTQGIEYSKREMGPRDRYSSGSFVMFAKSRNIRMLFQTTFTKKPIPEINIHIAVPVRDTFYGVSGNTSFYRSIKCKSCGGNGGLDGNCTTCPYCGGRGHANHVFKDESGRFEQMTHTECGVCGGKGCSVEHGQCPHCKGSGFVMERTSVAYTLAIGFADGLEQGYDGLGHEDLDGEVGRVKLKFIYAYPPMWSREDPSGLNLIYNLNIPYKEARDGFKNRFLNLFEELCLVQHGPIDMLTALTTGLDDVLIKGKGLLGPDAVTRGDVVVKMNVDMGSVTTEEMLRELKGTSNHQREGILGKLFDILSPTTCTNTGDDNDSTGQGSCDWKAENSEAKKRKESEIFSTSSDDITVVGGNV